MKYILLLIFIVSCTVSRQPDYKPIHIEYNHMDTIKKEIIDGIQFKRTFSFYKY